MFCINHISSGKSAGRGFVIFHEESSVDKVMLNRPYIINGQELQIYRSVPGQGSLKDTKGIIYLIVSDLKKGLIEKLDIQHYFSSFGKIIEIDMSTDQDSCYIEFKE